MSEPVVLKYRAFLSYSHADTGWVKWLHSKLEGFRIDKDLVGRETAAGQIPKTLRPIFRDREDFTAGHTLSDQTLAALDASQALIVICSPASAKSRYVNEEVRLFKARHPDRPVVPLIVAGRPDDPKDECFSRPLKFKVTQEGEITDLPEEPLAADVREEGDGKNLALAKVVAGLLGVSSDEIFRRAERERRRQGRIRSAIGLVIAGLVSIGGLLAWQAYQQRQTIAEVQALVAKYSVASPAGIASPDAKESLTQAITAIAEGAAGDPRYAKALDLLKAGKPAEAEPLLKAVAEEKEKRAASENKQAAAAYENLGAITRLSDEKRAREDFAKAAALDPDNASALYHYANALWGVDDLDASEQTLNRLLVMTQTEVEPCWIRIGLADIALRRGNVSSALELYRQAQSDVEHPIGDDNSRRQACLAYSYKKVGDIFANQGNLAEALQSYQNGLATMQRVAESEPNEKTWQLNQWWTNATIASTLAALGRPEEALKFGHDSLEIAERLAKSDPDNQEYQHSIGGSYEALGNIAVTQGKLADALQYRREALAIREKLVLADPDNDNWQDELASDCESIGGVLVEQGNADEAILSYGESLAIRKKLAGKYPGRSDRQDGLATTYVKLGDLQLGADRRDEALAGYQASLEIRQHLVEADPKNIQFQENEAASLSSIGNAKLHFGDNAGALAAYDEMREIARHLVAADQGNTQWQDLLGLSLAGIGKVKSASGESAEVLSAYEEVLVISRHLAETDQAKWQSNLLDILGRVGDLRLAAGDNIGALAAYDESLSMLRRLAEADPTTDRQGDLVNVLDKVGDAQLNSDKPEEALASYRESLAISRKQAKADPYNVQTQTNLVAELYKIATTATGDEKDAAIKEAVKILDPLASADKLSDDQKGWDDQILALRDPSKRGWLGLAVETVPQSIAPSLRLADNKGVLIAMVRPASPAERSGFEVGDVIISVDNALVQDANGFLKLLAGTDIGQNLRITVLRGGKPQLLEVALGELKVQSSLESETSSADTSVESSGHGQDPDGTDGEAQDSPTEDLDAHFLGEYFKDFATSPR